MLFTWFENKFARFVLRWELFLSKGEENEATESTKKIIRRTERKLAERKSA